MNASLRVVHQKEREREREREADIKRETNGPSPDLPLVTAGSTETIE
jgi:hypothetical protein